MSPSNIAHTCETQFKTVLFLFYYCLRKRRQYCFWYRRQFQGDHLTGKPGNVREFGTCQGHVRDVVNSQGIVREMSGKKSCPGKVSRNCTLLDEY